MNDSINFVWFFICIDYSLFLINNLISLFLVNTAIRPNLTPKSAIIRQPNSILNLTILPNINLWEDSDFVKISAILLNLVSNSAAE